MKLGEMSAKDFSKAAFAEADKVFTPKKAALSELRRGVVPEVYSRDYTIATLMDCKISISRNGESAQIDLQKAVQSSRIKRFTEQNALGSMAAARAALERTYFKLKSEMPTMAISWQKNEYYTNFERVDLRTASSAYAELRDPGSANGTWSTRSKDGAYYATHTLSDSSAYTVKLADNGALMEIEFDAHGTKVKDQVVEDQIRSLAEKIDKRLAKRIYRYQC